MKKMNQPQSMFDIINNLRKKGIPEKEFKRHIDHYLYRKACRLGIPLHGSFELTPFCNLDCKMCYVHLSSSQFSKKDLLSVDEWKSIIDQAHKAGMIKASLTGGECLTYSGFNELSLYLYNLGIIPGIMSNGLLLDKEQLDFLKLYPPKIIQISIYGSSDDAYERVTGKRAFSNVYHNLELAKEAHLPVVLTITPNRFMADDIQQLLEVVEDLNIPYNINSSLIVPRANTGRKLEDMSIDQYISLYKLKKKIDKDEECDCTGDIKVPDENHLGRRVFGLQCGGGRGSFTIKYDGSISPCASLYDISANTLEMGFLNAWKYINNLANNYPMPQECYGCVYHDYCLLCPAIHRNANRIGHCDPRVCERTKKLVQNGIIRIDMSNKG